MQQVNILVISLLPLPFVAKTYYQNDSYGNEVKKEWDDDNDTMIDRTRTYSYAMQSNGDLVITMHENGVTCVQTRAPWVP